MAAGRDSDFELSPLLDKLAEEYANEPKSRKFLPLAEEYRKSKMYEEAIFFLREGLKNHPHFLPAKLTLARCYIESKEFEEAKNICLDVISDFPDNLSFLRGLAESYYGLNDKEKALEYYGRILSLNPDDLLAERKRKEIEAELAASGSGKAASMSAIAEETVAEEETLDRSKPPEMIADESEVSDQLEVIGQVTETDQAPEEVTDTIDQIRDEEKTEPPGGEEEELALEEPDLDMEESLAGFSSDEVIEPTSEHEIPIPEIQEVEQAEEQPVQKEVEEVVFEPEEFVSPGEEDFALDLEDEDNIFETEDSPDFGHPAEVIDKSVQFEDLEDEATSTAKRKPLIELDLDLEEEVIDETVDLELTLAKQPEAVEEPVAAESPDEELEKAAPEAAEPQVEDVVAEEQTDLEEPLQEDYAEIPAADSETADADIEIMAPGGTPLEYEDLTEEAAESVEELLDLTPDFLVSEEEPEAADEAQELAGVTDEAGEAPGVEEAEEPAEAEQPSEQALEEVKGEARMILEESVFDELDLGSIDEYAKEETEEVDDFEDLTLSEQIEEIEQSLTDQALEEPMPVEPPMREEEEIPPTVELEEVPLEEEKVLAEETAETTPAIELVEESDDSDFTFIEEDQDAERLPSLDSEDELVPAGTTPEIIPKILPEADVGGEEEPIPVTLTSAKIYEEQGHYEEALRIYKKLLDREPYFKNIAERIVNLEKRMALARIPSTRKFSEEEVTKLEKWLNNIKSFKKKLKNWSTE